MFDAMNVRGVNVCGASYTDRLSHVHRAFTLSPTAGHLMPGMSAGADGPAADLLGTGGGGGGVGGDGGGAGAGGGGPRAGPGGAGAEARGAWAAARAGPAGRTSSTT